MVKNAPAVQRPGFDPWVGKIPWRREWQPTPVFLPGEFQGQRNLADCNPWCCKESDTIQQLNDKHFESLTARDYPLSPFQATSPYKQVKERFLNLPSCSKSHEVLKISGLAPRSSRTVVKCAFLSHAPQMIPASHRTFVEKHCPRGSSPSRKENALNSIRKIRSILSTHTCEALSRARHPCLVLRMQIKVTTPNLLMVWFGRGQVNNYRALR